MTWETVSVRKSNFNFFSTGIELKYIQHREPYEIIRHFLVLFVRRKNRVFFETIKQTSFLHVTLARFPVVFR